MNLDLDLLKTQLYIIKKLRRNSLRKTAGVLDGKLLDVGCGSKPYRRYLNCREYTGLDNAPETAPDITGSAVKIPSADAIFDSILCTEVLEHIPDPRAALSEMRRVLKPGGKIYITVPMEWGLHYEPFDYWRFTRYGIELLLKDNGFEVLETSRIGGLFTMLASRSLDFWWGVLVNLFSFSGPKNAERAASLLAAPVSLLKYPFCILLDKLEKKDALGWAVLARRVK